MIHKTEKIERLKKSFLYLLISISTIASCIPEPKDVGNLPIPKSQMVINNLNGTNVLFNTQEIYMGLLITKSFSLFSYDSNFSTQDLAELLVPNLEVRIVAIKDNKEVFMNASPLGFYYLQENNSFFQNYNDYQMIVRDTAENKEYKAVSTFLPSVSLNKLYIDGTILNDGERILPEVHFEFPDNPNEKNYYFVTARLLTTELNLIRELTNYDGGFMLLDDSELFDGQIKTSFVIAKTRLQFKVGDNLIVGLANITKEYYDYLTDYSKRAQGTAFLNEPYNVGTNITGDDALGFFSLHLTSFKVEKISPPRKNE